MANKKKKADYFNFTSPTTQKLFIWVFAALGGVTGMLFLLMAPDIIGEFIFGHRTGIFAPFDWFNTLTDALLVIILILWTIFGTIILYTYATNRYKEVENKQKIIVESPLLGVAKEHEEQIIECLKSIAKPTKGKSYLRRAGTVHFLRALTILGYMDANISGPNMMAWVEMVTGYKDKDADSGHFFSAYNNTFDQDPKVLDYKRQIEQIVGK